MANQFVGIDQLIIIAGFLSVMLAGWLMVRRYRGQILRNLSSGKRMRVIEETSLSPQERLRLVAVDNQPFLILSSKGQSPVVTPVVTAVIAPVTSPSAGNEMPRQAVNSPHATDKISARPDAGPAAASPAGRPVETPPARRADPGPIDLKEPVQRQTAALAGQRLRKTPSLAGAIAEARARNPLLGFGK